MPIESRDKTKPILVVGGAGYIGSHMVLVLRQAGFSVVVLDNLSKGHASAVRDAELIVGDIADKDFLMRLFAANSFSAVMHFASYIEVGESVNQPLKYYQNNVSATISLLEVMLQHKIKHFIFSSTAAVYGEPTAPLINEGHALLPLNPYGRSKKMVEDIIQDLARSDGLSYAILRYFNAAGADPDGRTGECHEPESHLVPLILQVAAKKRAAIFVYGNHYPTPDGTCIRDYVHVMDICQAHLLALNQLLKTNENSICNLGTGQGHSVFEVIDTAKSVTGCPIPVVISDARAGDPAILVADPSHAQQYLGWRPVYSTLDTIIRHAWQWMKCSHPHFSAYEKII